MPASSPLLCPGNGRCNGHTGDRVSTLLDFSFIPCPVSLYSTEGLEGSLMGPQELDKWLVGTVRAMQESMRNVQRRLQSLESKSQPREQVSVSLLH